MFSNFDLATSMNDPKNPFKAEPQMLAVQMKYIMELFMDAPTSEKMIKIPKSGVKVWDVADPDKTMTEMNFYLEHVGSTELDERLVGKYMETINEIFLLQRQGKAEVENQLKAESVVDWLKLENNDYENKQFLSVVSDYLTIDTSPEGVKKMLGVFGGPSSKVSPNFVHNCFLDMCMRLLNAQDMCKDLIDSFNTATIELNSEKFSVKVPVANSIEEMLHSFQKTRDEGCLHDIFDCDAEAAQPGGAAYQLFEALVAVKNEVTAALTEKMKHLIDMFQDDFKLRVSVLFENSKDAVNFDFSSVQGTENDQRWLNALGAFLKYEIERHNDVMEEMNASVDAEMKEDDDEAVDLPTQVRQEKEKDDEEDDDDDDAVDLPTQVRQEKEKDDEEDDDDDDDDDDEDDEEESEEESEEEEEEEEESEEEEEEEEEEESEEEEEEEEVKKPKEVRKPKQRIVIKAVNNNTPQEIAKENDHDVDVLIFVNVKIYPSILRGLRRNSKLEKGTMIALPTKADYEEARKFKVNEAAKAPKDKPATWQLMRGQRDRQYYQLTEQNEEFSMTNRPKLSVTQHTAGTFLMCAKSQKFWKLKMADGKPYWGPVSDLRGEFQPKKSKKAKKSAKEAEKMEVVEVSDDDEMDDAENRIIDIVNNMRDAKAKQPLNRAIEKAFNKAKIMKAMTSKKPKAAISKPKVAPRERPMQNGSFKRPRGRGPNGKEWCTATGEWVLTK